MWEKTGDESCICKLTLLKGEGMGMSSPAATYILLRDKTVFRIQIGTNQDLHGYVDPDPKGTDDPQKRK